MSIEKELLQQWNAAHGAAYELREEDLRWNLSKQKLIEYTPQWIADTPVLTAKATQDGISAGIPSKNLWLSLWGEIENENEFINELFKLKSKFGKSKVVIGGDEFHFVPGVPASSAGEKFKSELKKIGFEGAEAADYFGSVQSPAVAEYINSGKLLVEERKLSFTEVTSVSEIMAAEAFLSKEFPGRWTREFQFWASREDTQRAFWKLLRNVDQEIIGFARMAVRGRVLPLEHAWTPGALRVPTQLGKVKQASPKDCCLGPIGVASSQRGQGTGKALLGLVLESLRNLPTDRICIDWTNAFKYYEPLKFEIARRYWTAWKSDL